VSKWNDITLLKRVRSEIQIGKESSVLHITNAALHMTKVKLEKTIHTIPQPVI
jgi:hypothetical protein